MIEVKYIKLDREKALNYGVCGYKNLKRPGFAEKLNWMDKRFDEGLRVIGMIDDQERLQGLIEYIPGEYAWRPVRAEGYMFIHCLFAGFKKEYKGHGFASELIRQCEKDSESSGYKGVAVITRAGSFMADKDIFIKRGYKSVDSGGSDFELIVKKFDDSYPDPRIIDNTSLLNNYSEGLFILRADQCPYTVKNVLEIKETAEKEFNIEAKIIELNGYKEAQANPCVFGSFGIVYNGKVIAEHPISSTRFGNIMRKLLN